MTKLSQLKEWLTLDEAAAHISSSIGEVAAITDLYRFALAGHLTLSVNFVNQAKAKVGQVVKINRSELRTIEKNNFTDEELSDPISLPLDHHIHVSDDDWVALSPEITSISDIWDLTMQGSEFLDIENHYQQQTSGPEVALTCLEGTLVSRDNVVCQLQTDFDDNEYQQGASAQKQHIDRLIASNNLDDDEIKQLKAQFQTDRSEFYDDRKNKPSEEHYFPSGSLNDHDHVLVVRTNEVTRFIQSLDVAPSVEKPLISIERNSLLVLIGALLKQMDIDPNQRGITTAIVEMTELYGSALSENTIRNKLKQLLKGTPPVEKPLTSNERNSLLVLIGALCKQLEIDTNQHGIEPSLVEMTELYGSALLEDIIKSILQQIDPPTSSKS